MKLTVGTYNGLAYSILIQRTLATKNKDRAYTAEVYVADGEGEVIDSFNEYGGEDWQLRNACIKRIMTEVSHEYHNS